jgi:tetratricopeptide (TPR) repeat protein
MRKVLLALLALGSTAHAEDFWSSISEDDAAAMARRNYEKAMEEGDSIASLAISRASNNDDMRRQLKLALRAYENAELARPDAAEPHYRAGLILRNFFVECAPRAGFTWCIPGHPSASDAAKMADEWTAFVTLAPLDPRIDYPLMFDIAIANTHAVATITDPEKARPRLEAALHFYQAALARVNLFDLNTKERLGNMAETYMMLGRLDEAISTYEEVVRSSADSSTTYGLAVALDRDEQGQKAREVIRALGADEFDDFKARVADGDVFFVPDGEVFYYLALCEDAFGDDERAAIDWQHFIDSGAHPQFDDRARANLEALKKRKHKAPPSAPVQRPGRER